MTSRSELTALEKRDLADYGFARARDLAFDAVQTLWRRRQAEGMKKKDIATILERDPAWVSRNLKGPGNWTMRTFGELTAAMNGEIEIVVSASEDPLPTTPNYHAYVDFPLLILGSVTALDAIDEEEQSDAQTVKSDFQPEMKPNVLSGDYDNESANLVEVKI